MKGNSPPVVARRSNFPSTGAAVVK